MAINFIKNLEDIDILYRCPPIEDLDEKLRFHLRQEKWKEQLIILAWTIASVILFYILYIDGPKILAYFLLFFYIILIISISIVSHVKKINNLPNFIIIEKGIVKFDFISIVKHTIISSVDTNTTTIIPFNDIKRISINKENYYGNLNSYLIIFSWGNNMWNSVAGVITDIKTLIDILLPRIPTNTKWYIYEGKMAKQLNEENIKEKLEELCLGDCDYIG